MPGIGSTGLYIDPEDNHYAARVVGLSFVMKDGKPTVDDKGKPVLSGNFEVMGTFRDGTERLFSQVPAASLFEPEVTPETPPATSSPAT
jgi:hypothetical protein